MFLCKALTMARRTNAARSASTRLALIEAVTDLLIERGWAATTAVAVCERAGLTRGARQVGYALRFVPDDEPVPWHRVLRASGQIAFAEGSEQFNEQSKRLMMEGVRVNNGKVDMNEYRWRQDLDELLWKPSASWDGE